MTVLSSSQRKNDESELIGWRSSPTIIELWTPTRPFDGNVRLQLWSHQFELSIFNFTGCKGWLFHTAFREVRWDSSKKIIWKCLLMFYGNFQSYQYHYSYSCTLNQHSICQTPPKNMFRHIITPRSPNNGWDTLSSSLDLHIILQPNARVVQPSFALLMPEPIPWWCLGPCLLGAVFCFCRWCFLGVMVLNWWMYVWKRVLFVTGVTCVEGILWGKCLWWSFLGEIWGYGYVLPIVKWNWKKFMTILQTQTCLQHPTISSP